MKKLFFLFCFLLIPHLVFAQPNADSLQNAWLKAFSSGSTQQFDLENRKFTFAEIDSAVTSNILDHISSKTLSETGHYVHEKNFRNDDLRYVSAGTLILDQKGLILLSAWWNDKGEWKKGLDVILTKHSSLSEVNNDTQIALQQERELWVELANQHVPVDHVQRSYAEDALYFGNGQKSMGHFEIAGRYAYMENPNYKIELVEEQLWNISDSNVLEVGRYYTGWVRSGDGGLYIILWEKQHNGSWKIALDFNF